MRSIIIRVMAMVTSMQFSIAVMISGALLIGGSVVGVRLIDRADANDPDGNKSTETTYDPEKPRFSDPNDAPPPPPREQLLVDKKGYLQKLPWDDRHIPEADRLAQPLVNPRWAPFARCMAAGGMEVRRQTGSGFEPFVLQDLHALIDQLNSNGPLVTIEAGQFVVHHTDATRLYVKCNQENLQVFSEDLYKILTPEELAEARASGFAPK